MAAQTGLTIVKRFTYRGDTTEEYSNTYWLTGTVPANAAAWRTLFDALVAIEKTVYPSTHSVVRGYGYDDNEGHRSSDPDGTDVAPAVWSVDMTSSPNTPVAGTQGMGSAVPGPGDAACWVRWKTSRLTTKGKPIYLRKYFHGVAISSSTGGDALTALQITNLNALGTTLRDGSFAEGRHVTAAGETDTLVSSSASSFATTRTLKRRGKRPNS